MHSLNTVATPATLDNATVFKALDELEGVSCALDSLANLVAPNAAVDPNKLAVLLSLLSRIAEQSPAKAAATQEAFVAVGDLLSREKDLHAVGRKELETLLRLIVNVLVGAQTLLRK